MGKNKINKYIPGKKKRNLRLLFNNAAVMNAPYVCI